MPALVNRSVGSSCGHHRAPRARCGGRGRRRSRGSPGARAPRCGVIVLVEVGSSVRAWIGGVRRARRRPDEGRRGARGRGRPRIRAGERARRGVAGRALRGRSRSVAGVVVGAAASPFAALGTYFCLMTCSTWFARSGLSIRNCARLLAALAEADLAVGRVLDRVPRARLDDDAGSVDADVEHLALAADAAVEQDVELALRKGGATLFFTTVTFVRLPIDVRRRP